MKEKLAQSDCKFKHRQSKEKLPMSLHKLLFHAQLYSLSRSLNLTKKNTKDLSEMVVSEVKGQISKQVDICYGSLGPRRRKKKMSI